MNPLGIFISGILCLVVLTAPRIIAALGVVGAMCYITQGQAVNIAGFNFTAIRLVLLFAFIRVFVKGEIRQISFNKLDKLVIGYAISLTVLSFLCRRTTGALVYQLGCDFNILLPYFFFRSVLKTTDDVFAFARGLAITIAPLCLAMILEAQTGRNLYNTFGGVNAYSELRDGHYRCSGAFRSPITAGAFGATLMPLFVTAYIADRKKRIYAFGAIAATSITIASHSSGPLLAYVGSTLALLLWTRRTQMRSLRRTVAIALIGLHLVMKAPVWFLIARISDIVGGGGWHRAFLIDQSVNMFSSWWLWGTEDTSAWMPTQLAFGGADITNQFVSAGVNGGLLSMALLIWIFVTSFSYLGKTMRFFRLKGEKIEWYYWGLGSAVFGTMLNFFSVSYFDQVEVLFYCLIAVIASTALGEVSQPVIQEAENGERIDGSFLYPA